MRATEWRQKNGGQKVYEHRTESVGSAFWPFWRRNIHGANFLLVWPSAGRSFRRGRRKRQARAPVLPVTRREWKEINWIAFQSRWPEGYVVINRAKTIRLHKKKGDRLEAADAPIGRAAMFQFPVFL